MSAVEQEHACRQLFTIPQDYHMDATANAELIATILESEVRDAIRGLSPHKAAGPDRLGNDFYRDWEDVLASRLTVELNRILVGGDMPSSFGEAIVVFIPKEGDATVGTNYRPISLLCSSYKILTKVIANRTQTSLGTVINADQNGLVRGRDLTNNINLMRAILGEPATSSTSASSSNSAVILLDFRKAYDTLDRHFASIALRAFGYGEAFVRLVERLHANTRATFLVNGELSAPRTVVSEIRQGCPLAQLLFLIAAETLKHTIDQAPGISGITMAGLYATHTHTFSAFVDDSVVFLGKGSMVSHLEAVLDDFAAVSGLQVQPGKSHAIVLHTQCFEGRLGTFPTAVPGTTVRYLGVEVGLADLHSVNWAQRLASVRKRLGILSQYTTGVSDRTQVINIACVPSLLFTAKFFTPLREVLHQLDQLLRQYVWKGTVTARPIRAHKVAREIVHLPTRLGGLGLVNYRGAMLVQMATQVLTWNTRPHDKYWEAFNTLLGGQLGQDGIIRVYPSPTAAPPVELLGERRGLMADGYHAVNLAIALQYPHPPTLIQQKTALMATLTSPAAGFRWLTSSNGSLRLRLDPHALSTLARQVYASMPSEIRSFRPTFPWFDNAWVMGHDGHPLRRRDYPFIKITELRDLQLFRVTE